MTQQEPRQQDTPQPDPPWAYTPRRQRIGNAYPTVREVVDVFKNLWWGPSREDAGITEFLAQRYPLADVDPRLRIGFVGDVLPAFDREIVIGEDLQGFLSDCDYLALNLEGVPSDDRWVFNAYKHSPEIIDMLAGLFPPERTIVCLANNHAGDCGWRAFADWRRSLRDAGFLTLGQRDEPRLTLPAGVLLANGTQWSNVPAPYLATLDMAAGAAGIDDEAKLNILLPHWGWEMRLYPPPRLLQMADELLPRWDAIIGTHSHCPQPITLRQGKLLATSLGNFHRGDGAERAMHGLALKVTAGPDAGGVWRIGEAQWTFVRPAIAGQRITMDAAEACRFFAQEPVSRPYSA